MIREQAARKLAEDIIYPLEGSTAAVDLAVRLIMLAVTEDELKQDIDGLNGEKHV